MYLSEEEENDNRMSLLKFESMLKTNKVFFFDSEEFEDIILHYLDSGKINLAKKALKIAQDQHPKSTGLLLVQVEMLIFENKLESAEKLLNDLYAIEPNNEEIYIQKANICSKRDLHEKAVEYLKIALKYTDDFADVYNLIGMEYLFMDDMEQAKIYFSKCLNEDLEDQTALYNVVYCYEFLDQYDEAIEFLNKYLDKNAYSEIAWHQLGRLYYTIKDYEEAINAFDYATLIDDSFLGAFMEKAKAYERLKQYQNAINSYKQTLILEDATSYAMLRLAKCYEKIGENANALHYFKKTIHEDPLLDKGWNGIIDFFIRQNQLDLALEYINEALDIDHQNPKYWKRFALINKKMDNLDQTELGYRKAVEFGDADIDTWLYWIDIILDMQEFEFGIQSIELVKNIQNDLAELDYRLAVCYFMLDNKIEFKEHLLKALISDFQKKDFLQENYPDIWNANITQEVLRNIDK